MPISISCECGKRMAVREDLTGKRVRCPECNAVVTVPEPEANGHEAPAGPILTGSRSGGESRLSRG